VNISYDVMYYIATTTFGLSHLLFVSRYFNLQKLCCDNTDMLYVLRYIFLSFRPIVIFKLDAYEISSVILVVILINLVT
jgi:hypothetical protein